jgi:uncharacterized membrane protein SpoIIM required for sporulation
MTMAGEGPTRTTTTVTFFTALLLTFLLLVYVVCLSSLLQNDLKQYIRLMFSKPDIKISGGSKIKTG